MVAAISSSISATLTVSATADRTHIRHGKVQDSTDGKGTFETVLSQSDGVRSSDTTIHYANGTSAERDATITKNDDGSLSLSVTSTRPDGTTRTRNETITKNGDGTASVTGSVTQADGSVDSISGTISRSSHGRETDLTLTNSDGQTATLDTQRVRHGDVIAYDTTGTGFNGQDISHQSRFKIEA